MLLDPSQKVLSMNWAKIRPNPTSKCSKQCFGYSLFCMGSLRATTTFRLCCCWCLEGPTTRSRSLRTLDACLVPCMCPALNIKSAIWSFAVPSKQASAAEQWALNFHLSLEPFLLDDEPFDIFERSCEWKSWVDLKLLMCGQRRYSYFSLTKVAS